ncbi:MAG TPA: ABC transporter permease [Aquamicrobium sp.]|nr:ABC transporter permease [Aquamicrobium sp.]
MFHFILADLRRNRIGVAILGLLVALATALGVAVTLQERALRLGSARAAAPFDLVVGAPGSEAQLVLSSVFLQPAPLPLLPARVLAELRADPRVAAAVPVGFGDFVRDYPIVGTTPDAVAMLGELAEGSGLDHPGDAVAGAQVTLHLGARFHPFHGTAGEPGEVHSHAEYRIVGRMAPTGTPWDRAILVPIQSVWDVHADHAHAHAHDADEDHGHDHDHGESGARPLDDAALADPDNPGVPAIVVKPRSFADAYALRQQYRAETTMAVFPGEVLTRLYGTLGDARRVLSAVAAGAQALVGAAILMVVAVHVLERRRQIGALRAFGAPRAVVLAMVWLEVFVILAFGLLAGFAVGYAAVRALSRRLAEASGVALPVEFQPADAWTLLAFLCMAAVVTLLPALIACRQTPARALRS